MTVLISKPSLNLREELAALRNQGGYSEQQFDFDGLVTNGTFDSVTTNWAALAATLSIDNTRLKVLNTSAARGRGYQLVDVVVGEAYLVSVSVVEGNNTARVRLGSTSDGTEYFSDTNKTTGAYTYSVVATTTTLSVGLQTEAAVLNDYVLFDNISVFNTDGTNVIHTTPAGWLPKDVFVDGLLKREGSGWDYTVHNDGTKYWIKPTVAPSATTTTTILGVRL